MARIKKLDSLITNKIAAGEVIERPSSIVKELIENSIDAGSTEILIDIKNGGKNYIRVTDNGSGINKEDISLAFDRYSTSKLHSIEDLSHISTLGFRGEALASISAVSKINLITKTNFSEIGTSVYLEDGKIISSKSIGSPIGTTIIIEDLFYNLPVRKNFLKSDISETTAISNVLYRQALGNPNITFKYTKDNIVSMMTQGQGNYKNNIYNILGRDVVNSLIDFTYIDEEINLKAFISNTQLYRGNRSHQYLYVNGRYVESEDIRKIIENNYKSLIPINKYPIFIIYLEVKPDVIDVNIHPTKEAIKFSNGDLLFDKIDNIIKDVLKENRFIPKSSTLIKRNNSEENHALTINQSESFSLFDLKEKEDEILSLNKNSKDFIEFDELYNLKEDEAFYESENIADSTKIDLYESTYELKKVLNDLKLIGVAFKTYIICENLVEESLYFIDQHAAHERIMYEKLVESYNKEIILTQEILSPIILELNPVDMDKVLFNLRIFNDLGFDIEQFGINSIIIRKVPLVFGEPKSERLFFEIIDNLSLDVKSNYSFYLDKIIKQACTSAIKAGDVLDEIEIVELFNLLKNCKNPFTCPHGRPTMIKISKNELEKDFLRII